MSTTITTLVVMLNRYTRFSPHKAITSVFINAFTFD
jgi:hypothetical protein